MKSHRAAGSLNSLSRKMETSCPTALKHFLILNNPDTFHLCPFYFSHFEKKRKRLILIVLSVSCYFSWKYKLKVISYMCCHTSSLFSDLPVQHDLPGTAVNTMIYGGVQ